MKNTSDKIYIKTKDFLVSGETFSLILDDQRKMLFTSPIPDEKNLSEYYKSNEYISHTDSKKGLLNFLYQNVKNYSLSKKTSLLKKQNRGVGSVLDIGAGTGDFLKRAKEKGWNVNGVEVNKKARNLSFAKGIALKESIDEFSGQQFDVVTLWHVLEHLPNLEATILKIEKLVKKGGVLIIAVPNFNSFDAKHYKEFWAAYDAPRHLWHFSRKSMNIIFSENIKLIKTLPMLFDSFYVSLLSEKYKSGKSFSIKSFWIGFFSNLKAIRSKEYSSLIYVFKKGKNPV